jgi:hypothetical protein
MRGEQIGLGLIARCFVLMPVPTIDLDSELLFRYQQIAFGAPNLAAPQHLRID